MHAAAQTTSGGTNSTRCAFAVPKGKKEVITAYAAAHGESINAFINRLIDEEMAKAEAEK